MTDRRKLNLTFILIAGMVLAVRVFTSPWRFPDFDTYLLVSDALAFQPIRDNLVFEPLSTGFILSLRYLTGNAVDGLIAAHWALSAIFLIGFYKVMATSQQDWKAALVTIGLYGSLLAFVTVRATPAYLLVWLAAIYASQGRVSSLLLAAVAIGFHSSAALATPAVAICYFQQKSRFFASFWRNNVLIGSTVALIAVVFSLSYLVLVDYLFTVINLLGPFLGKYMVYVSAFEGNEGSSQATSESALFHLAYLIGASVLTIAFIATQDEGAKRLRSYVTLSFFVFVFLSASPVSAYRQSLFWTVPAILYLPWRRLSFAGFGTVAICLFGLAGFFLGVRSILI